MTTEPLRISIPFCAGLLDFSCEHMHARFRTGGETLSAMARGVRIYRVPQSPHTHVSMEALLLPRQITSAHRALGEWWETLTLRGPHTKPAYQLLGVAHGCHHTRFYRQDGVLWLASVAFRADCVAQLGEHAP